MPYNKKSYMTPFPRKPKYRKPKKVYKKKKKYTKKVNSIRNTFESSNTDDKFALVIPSKGAKMSDTIQISDTVESSIPAVIVTNNNLLAFQKNFRNGRCVTLQITLTPEKWQATSDASVTGSSIKPKIHWINDDGATHQYLESISHTGTLSFQQAKSFGAVYHEANFTKPFTFNIKLYSRQLATSSDKYLSASQWRCTAASFDNYISSLPLSNFWFGFSEFSTTFQYSTRYKLVCDYKNPSNDDLFP